MPDFIIKAGDTQPFFEDSLSYSNGESANLEGATVTFVMRRLTLEEPQSLKGTVEITKAKEGGVRFKPAAEDTSVPGDLMAYWHVKFATGGTMTFPTTGYLWVEIQESLSAKSSPLLVGLPEVKDYLNLSASDRTHDAKLIAHIEAITGQMERLIGPIIPTVYDEWYEGGHAVISLRHKPSYGYGANPVFKLMAVSEYRGPIEYNLSIVGVPTQGSVYSTMLNAELGTIVRRTAGGGTYPFWSDPEHPWQSIHAIYAAGQEPIPRAVRTAALEAIRVHYENTMMVGRGFQTVADAQEPSMPLGFYMPRHCLEILEPLRTHPVLV